MRWFFILLLLARPVLGDALVVSQSEFASQAGAGVMAEGGNAVDAAVATAFALAVTHPTAGNIGGGGFLVFRSAGGETAAYDFRETAPAAANPSMFLRDGKYDSTLHHNSHLAVGVPGTVAGLHLAWTNHGKLPWPRLVAPAIRLARDGFPVSKELAASLRAVLPSMKPYPAALSQFSKAGQPYAAGDLLRQPDLARTLQRIADQGPAGFYEGETALLIEQEMLAHQGLIRRDDLKKYRAVRRDVIRGTYRDYEILSMPPPSSGGIALVEMLNILEGFNLRTNSPAQVIHLMAESMRRAFADRALSLGDPDFNPDVPVKKLISKEYAASLRRSIHLDHASKSSPDKFSWAPESDQTTHLSVVDANQNAVALTYTLEQGYGSKIVVPGAGFLLNNEMGDFNAAPGLTTVDGLIGTAPNLAHPGQRMLSSMSPTIVIKNGRLFMVTGSPGGRTIINTVLETIVNAIDFEMDAQKIVDAPRFHHQWLPDEIKIESPGFSPEVVAALASRGHIIRTGPRQGVAEVILVRGQSLEAGIDLRDPDSAAARPQPLR